MGPHTFQTKGDSSLAICQPQLYILQTHAINHKGCQKEVWWLYVTHCCYQEKKKKTQQLQNTGPTDNGWHLEDTFQGSCCVEIGGN